MKVVTYIGLLFGGQVALSSMREIKNGVRGTGIYSKLAFGALLLGFNAH